MASSLISCTVQQLVANLNNQVTIKLDGTNYIPWQAQVTYALKGNRVLKYVDGSFPPPKPISTSTVEKAATTSPTSTPTPTLSSTSTTSSSSTHSSTSTSISLEDWFDINDNLISFILSTLDPAIVPHGVGFTYVSDMWKALTDRYSTQSTAQIHNLRAALFKTAKGTLNMREYLDKVKSITDALATASVILSDQEISVYILNGLPSEYDSLSTHIRARNDPITIPQLSNLLFAEELHILNRAAISNPSLTFDNPTALQANRNQNFPHTNNSSNTYRSNNNSNYNNRGNNGGNNFNGGKNGGGNRGYYKGNNKGNYKGNNNQYRGNRSNQGYNNGFQGQNNNNSYQGQNNNNSYNHVPICQFCDRPGHTAKTCYQKSASDNSRFPPPQAYTASDTYTPNAQFLMDSGANNHVTNNLSHFNTFDPYQGHDRVTVGNGVQLPIYNTGQSQEEHYSQGAL